MAAMIDTAQNTLDVELTALEAALPYLRRSMSPDAFSAHLRECCRDILASARSGEDTAHIRAGLAAMLGPDEMDFRE